MVVASYTDLRLKMHSFYFAVTRRTDPFLFKLSREFFNYTNLGFAGVANVLSQSDKHTFQNSHVIFTCD